MNIFVYLMMTIIFIYNTGFAVTLWKEPNKVGAIAVMVLGLVVVVGPFFTILK